MVRRKDHCVVNIYGEDTIDTVENAIEIAMDEDGAEDVSEAMRIICAAYSGFDFAE